MIDIPRHCTEAKPIRIRWALFMFEARPALDRTAVCVARIDRYGLEVARIHGSNEEEAARQWLGDMGLDSRQARRLLDAALRGVGPFASASHPRRVTVATEAGPASTATGPAAAIQGSATQSSGIGCRGRGEASR